MLPALIPPSPLFRPGLSFLPHPPRLPAGEREAPDPWTLSGEALDHLFDIEQALAESARMLDRETHRFLYLLAAFDLRRGWELAGHVSCASWLAANCGMDPGTARERVRIARALGELPQVAEAFAMGELTFSKVRALTRVATPETEEALLELALEHSAASLERILRMQRLPTESDELEREERRHKARTLSLYPDAEGMIEVRGRLTPELGALLMKAIEAASDTLYRSQGEELLASPRERERMAGQRRADALGLLAERALGVIGGGDREEGEAGEGENGAADEGGAAGAGGPSGSTPARYQVFLHVGERTLRGEGSGDCGCGSGAEASGNGADGIPADTNRSDLEPGIRVSAETSRRLTCDASVVPVTRAPSGQILNVGRKTRTIPPALRRALHLRDGSCRFPGCASTHCEAHHIRHWAKGGETRLGNTLLLCRHHHRLVHEGSWTLTLTPTGNPMFRSPRGAMVVDFRGTPILREEVG